jgi:hypothetical protein
MVDFKKHLGKAAQAQSLVHPVDLYETLDRQSDKGPLRPAQEAVLKNWHDGQRSKKDVILKLHTGQGKTLIGLLMLQSKLNEKKGPALYLTPNKFLANQTREQADQFGINYVTLDRDLPHDFLDSKAILITHAQKLFNGKSTFGISSASEHVASIVVDDSHACIDAIRQAFIIRGDFNHPLHSKLLDLFGTELEKQGAGTFQDINNHSYDSLLSVPYWDWYSKVSDVAAVLSKHSDTREVKFVWPLLKDMLQHCQCLISGQSFEIGPYVPPLEQFGSFHGASHRVFMSATVSDDSFFVKGLGLSSDVITSPLMYEKEKWSGEKMLLIPSLIDESLGREEIVKWLGPPDKNRSYGVVVLAPSFSGCKDWKAYGATVANTEDIDAAVASLRAGKYKDTLVIANRYDGIDLPEAGVGRLRLTPNDGYGHARDDDSAPGEVFPTAVTRTCGHRAGDLGRESAGWTARDRAVGLKMDGNTIRMDPQRRSLGRAVHSRARLGIRHHAYPTTQRAAAAVLVPPRGLAGRGRPRPRLPPRPHPRRADLRRRHRRGHTGRRRPHPIPRRPALLRQRLRPSHLRSSRASSDRTEAGSWWSSRVKWPHGYCRRIEAPLRGSQQACCRSAELSLSRHGLTKN